MKQPDFLSSDISYDDRMTVLHDRTGKKLPKKNPIDRWNQIIWPYTFPWRKEQDDILCAYQDHSTKNKYQKIMVIQAVFGGGKTTMLLALLYDLILQGLASPSEIFICAFNVAIKNEIRKKCRVIGKVYPRTYDSLIYEICKELEYPDLLCQNFEEKRRFVQSKLDCLEPQKNIRFVMVDESQDLDFIAYQVFQKRFPDAFFLFVGDIFQSIQKEPRESLLWNLLQDSSLLIHHMKNTPRVPDPILSEMKQALTTFYPEFHETIHDWSSSSQIVDTKIKWKNFDSYRNVMNDMLVFLKKHPINDCMILVFSSAVTVKGSLGDVSRTRKFLMDNNIPVNSNHKRMMDDSVFLSTVQSSKGLERPHVFCFLSFPLEAAFAQFSTDLLMNLITVAVSRCKQSIFFQVPRHIERFSPILRYYIQCPCPPPQKNILSEKEDPPSLHHKRFMLEKEQGITEILRLQMLSFSTRRHLKKSSHRINSYPLCNSSSLKKCITTEEEAVLVGLIFETLILSHWRKSWISIPSSLRNNPEMYASYQPKIHAIEKQYTRFVNTHHYPNGELKGCILYARFLIARQHNIFINATTEMHDSIHNHWKELIPKFSPIRPQGEIRIQHNLGMPFVTGIADALIPADDAKKSPLVIYEIKASKAKDWLENALLQAILYSLCMGQKKCTIHLVNVLSPTIQTFNVFFENMSQSRSLVMEQIRQWNLNCYLAKNRSLHDPLKKTFNVARTYFLDGRLEQHQLCLFEITSPTKTVLISTFSGEMEVQSFLQKDIHEWIEILKIRKLLLGRHLYLMPCFKIIKECNIIPLGHSSRSIHDHEWYTFLTKTGWFEPDSNVSMENRKTYLDWNLVQCSFMIQWAHICDSYNLNNIKPKN